MNVKQIFDSSRSDYSKIKALDTLAHEANVSFSETQKLAKDGILDVNSFTIIINGTAINFNLDEATYTGLYAFIHEATKDY